jgi:hypothetical protein
MAAFHRFFFSRILGGMYQYYWQRNLCGTEDETQPRFASTEFLQKVLGCKENSDRKRRKWKEIRAFHFLKHFLPLLVRLYVINPY